MKNPIRFIAIRLVLAFTLLLPAVGCVQNLAPQPPADPGPNPNEGFEPLRSTTPSIPPAPELPMAGKVTPPERGAYHGLYSPPAPFTLDAIKDAEDAAGKQVAILAWYQPWERRNRSKFDTGTVIAVLRRGIVPMISWEPWDPGEDANQLEEPANNPRYRLSTIVSGRHDAYIRDWARAIKSLGGPVMLRPMHEMNGFWYPWGGTANGNRPQEFISAWRRMHRIFEQEGATNVTWVWSINHASVPREARNEYSVYYPGDAYVDWTAISGFNWGASTNYSNWGSFMHWYEEPLAYLRTLDKPICIAEIGAVEQGGDKAAWIQDAYRQIRRQRQVKAVVYYNAIERGLVATQDWRFTTSAQSRRAYGRAVAPAYFVADTPPALKAWGDSLTPEQRLYLAAFRQLY